MSNTSIVLCKNAKSAKLLFERYCELCRKAGENAKVDRKHLALQFDLTGTNVIIRFISPIAYYNAVCRGNDKAIIIGDKEFDRRMDELEKRGAKKIPMKH